LNVIHVSRLLFDVTNDEELGICLLPKWFRANAISLSSVKEPTCDRCVL
jgi:hypothetical protein